MKIIVISDSHSAAGNVSRILNREVGCDAVIFLGDGNGEAQSVFNAYKGKLYRVKGNCDSSALGLPEEGELYAAGKKVFFCHGHKYQVKWGLDVIADEAAAKNADIVLYGHTHIADQSFRNGIYVINPGAASGANASYGILEVRENGVLFSIVQL